MSETTLSRGVSLRELDDEYLQKRAKKWLEAVLGVRFDNQALADALADGDILHRVSKLLKVHLPDFREEATSPKLSSRETVFQDRRSGKYLPYSYVDSFLRKIAKGHDVCKKLRLPDIDLFSPPDVVEKKDIRKVCLCIRALSKKARANQIRIPDFDNVSGTMAILHDKVTGIDPVGENGDNSSMKDGSATPESKLKSESCSRELSSVHSITSLETQSSYQESNGPLLSPQAINAQVGYRNKDSAHSREDQTYSSADLQDLPSEKSQSPFSLDNIESTCLPISRSTDELGSSASTNIQQHCTTNMQKQEKNLNGTGHSNGEVKKAGKFGLWLPIVAGAATLIGVVLTRRPREPEIYEVKTGDTLSEISRKTGRTGWQKLVDINPGIKDPNLIYPSERLRLHG